MPFFTYTMYVIVAFCGAQQNGHFQRSYIMASRLQTHRIKTRTGWCKKTSESFIDGPETVSLFFTAIRRGFYAFFFMSPLATMIRRCSGSRGGQLKVTKARFSIRNLLTCSGNDECARLMNEFYVCQFVGLLCPGLILDSYMCDFGLVVLYCLLENVEINSVLLGSL